MSITLERPGTASAPASIASPAPSTTSTGDVVWTKSYDVQPPVWVGRYKDVYLGMIEHREPEGFAAITHRGRGLGNFATIEEAQRSFYR